jgi:hypothetical protein
VFLAKLREMNACRRGYVRLSVCQRVYISEITELISVTVHRAGTKCHGQLLSFRHCQSNVNTWIASQKSVVSTATTCFNVRQLCIFQTVFLLSIFVYWVVMLCARISCIFNPEDGDRMFFRNALKQVQTALQLTRTTSTYLPSSEPQLAHTAFILFVYFSK